MPLKLYEYKCVGREMFVIDALISSVNDLIYITERLIYQREYGGTLGSSSASLFLVGSLGAGSLQCRGDSEGCGSVSKAKYSGRYMMRDRGRKGEDGLQRDE